MAQQLLYRWFIDSEGRGSSVKPLLSKGVPQGSILGPTLFSIFVNITTHYIHFYADDTILYTSSPSLRTALSSLQTSFNSIQFAFANLKLKLNTNKITCMLFNKNLPQNHPLTISSLDVSFICREI